jgi:hypothetical protein
MRQRLNMNGLSTIPPEWPDENCDILYGMKAMLGVAGGTFLFGCIRWCIAACIRGTAHGSC